MSKRMSTGKKVLIGGVVVAAVGGIGYFIWKKMKEAEEDSSIQAQSSAMSGMGAASGGAPIMQRVSKHWCDRCHSNEHCIENPDWICCVSNEFFDAGEICLPNGAKPPRGYINFGPYGCPEGSSRWVRGTNKLWKQGCRTIAYHGSYAGA